LVAQWQDELSSKFSLQFSILTRDAVEASLHGNPFVEEPLLIARMDQLSRSEELQSRLSSSEWDLIVVDEAHRMSAHYQGDEVRETQRYRLGKLLGGICRHFLLLTATPHSGKDEDFQLFLSLLDPDRFAGRGRGRAGDVSDLQRRMIKEKILRFDGRPLFPERRATTVPFPLCPLEMELYEEVTQYVREEMNRADRPPDSDLDRKSGDVVADKGTDGARAWQSNERRAATLPWRPRGLAVRRAPRGGTRYDANRCAQGSRRNGCGFR
jgi:SNF2 family DNA or RNA helicase